MKKIAAVLLVLSVALSCTGCVSKSEYSVLYNAVERANAEKVYSNTFQFTVVNATTDATVCFSQGKANIDKSNTLKMSGTMTQYVIGEYSSANFAYINGEYYTAIGDNKVVVPIEESSIINEFLCGETPNFDVNGVKKLSVETDGLVKTYTFTAQADKELLSNLVGLDVYTLLGMTSVDVDLTEFSKVECVYTTTDNGDSSVLLSRSLTFSIKAYSKLPYLAGVKVDKEDYRTDINISCYQSFTKFGDVEVEIPNRDEYTDITTSS